MAILIPNYNGKNLLEKCLKSILMQSYDNYKVFLIDNASTDGSAEFVQRNFPTVNVIKNNVNLGFGAYNAVILLTIDEFDYIIFHTNDTIVDEDWLQELVFTMEKRTDVGLCNSLIVSSDGEKVEHAGGCIYNILGGVFGGYLVDFPVKDLSNIKKNTVFPVFHGCVSMIIRSSLLKETGFFDPTFFLHVSDVDLSWRVLLRGYKVVCNSKSIVYHYGSGTPRTKGLYLFIMNRIENNTLATYYKNLSLRYLVFIFIPLFLTRFCISLLSLQASREIFTAKIEGLKSFFDNYEYYHRLRKQVQHKRIKSDSEIFAQNPTQLISFASILPSIEKWLNAVQSHLRKSITVREFSIN